MSVYFTTLGPGSPKGALGVYEHGTGRLVLYSDGTPGDDVWFFAMADGTPSFYVSDGAL
jgi:hypothetical protein